MTTETVEPTPLDCHECPACGYIYEPNQGDSKHNIEPGIPFEDLPATWRCPVCGVKKVKFQNIGPAQTASGFKENLGFGLGVNSLTSNQKSLLIFGALALGFLILISFYGLE